MANAIFVPRCPALRGVMEVPSGRGRWKPQHMMALERQTLPTDPVGTFTLTLTNVVIGSRYRAEVLSTGATIVDGVAAATAVILSIPVYTSGSALNDLRIKVRNASGSPAYQPYDTQATAVIGAASIYVNQLLDE